MTDRTVKTFFLTVKCINYACDDYQKPSATLAVLTTYDHLTVNTFCDTCETHSLLLLDAKGN